MPLKSQIQDDMKSAMKAGEKDRLKVVRLILAAIKQQEVDQRTELDDAAILAVLSKMVKQRRDSVTQFRDGGRDDLADAEQAEIAILEHVLPEPLSAAEIEQLIRDAIAEIDRYVAGRVGHAAPEGLLPYTRYSWVVANDRLRAQGWEPRYSSAQAFVIADVGMPWDDLNARQRQYATLVGAGAAVAVGGWAAAAWLRRSYALR